MIIQTKNQMEKNIEEEDIKPPKCGRKCGIENVKE